MHVLVAAHDFYPDPGSGGTGRYVHETATRLADRGRDVSVLTRRRGDVPPVETVAGVDVHRYDLEIADRSGVAVAAQLPAAREAVAAHLGRIRARNGPPDVLSFQGSATALLADHLVDDTVPRLTTFHSPWAAEYRLRARAEGRLVARLELNAAIRRRLERRLLDHSDDVVALSAYMRDRMRDLHGPLGADVVPGGVDHERYAPDAGPFAPIEAVDGPAFLTVRRLSPRMGHDLLLRAFASVTETHPGARLFVAGDGSLRGRLERLADDLGVGDATTFLGYVPDEALPAAHATADVFVLPTRRLEGFGLATLEALASGTPVLATPVGGTVEVLSGLPESDFPAPALIEDVDPGPLARAMRAWADVTPERRERAGRACRAHVREHYTWERTVAALDDRYATLAAGDAGDGCRRSDVAPVPAA